LIAPADHTIETLQASEGDAISRFFSEQVEPKIVKEFLPLGVEVLGEWIALERTIALKAQSRDGADLRGLVISSRPASGRDSTWMLLFVGMEHRRQGFGTALEAACLEILGDSIAKIGSVVGETNCVGRRFLEARGYAVVEKHYQMSRVPEPFEPVEVEGFAFDIYRGGDRATNEAIADQNRRLYAHDRVAYFTTPEEVEMIFEHEGRLVILARAEETGEIAGFVDLTKEAFVCNLGVARKFWGTGLAHELARRTIAMGVELGAPRVRSFVRASNAASIRMQKRVGMEINDVVLNYERQLAPVEPASP
jgi:ribosomal protein S18 acetylase RimI-like enzyme